MSTSMPLWWLHADVLQQLAAEFDAIAHGWAQDWGASAPAAGTARALTARQLTAAAKLAEQTDVAGPWLKPSQAMGSAARQAIFGNGAGAGPIAKEVGTLAAAALLDGLRAALRWPTHTPAAPRPADASASTGHGGAAYTVTVGEQEVEILVPTAWLHARGWLKRPAVKAVAGWSPAKVLAHVPIQLTVELGRTELSVGSLSAIGPDDVILVGNATTDPIVMRVDGSDQKLRAFLGRQGAQRAVQIVAAPK
jgi:flagellar motor switch/type III secretory pathway protein FliN